MSPSPAALEAARLARDLVLLEGRGGGTEDYAEALALHGVPALLTFRQTVALAAWARLLRPVFTAATPRERCRAVDVLLYTADVRPRLEVGPGSDSGASPRWRFDTVGAADGGGSTGTASPAGRGMTSPEDVVPLIRARSAGGLALFVVETGGRRLGACAAPWCGAVFVDESRNGLRRHCSARCGGDLAVRRHRERRERGAGAS